jgi:large subunit ribosomal protein L17
MRHAKKGRKLGTDASHSQAMLRSLARALFISERIKTTEARAKEVRSLVERIITWGKKGDVHSRRLALAELNDRELVHKIFADIAPRFAEREGGYTRILKLGPRKGDAAPMVIMELVD